MSCPVLRRIHGGYPSKTTAVVWMPVRRQTVWTRAAAAATILAPPNVCHCVHQRHYHQAPWKTPITDGERSTRCSDGAHGQRRMLPCSGHGNRTADTDAFSLGYATVDGRSRGAVPARERTHSLRSSQLQPESLQVQRQRQVRPRRPSSIFMEPPDAEKRAAETSSSPTPLSTDAVRWSFNEHVADVQDDDIVLDTPASLLPCMSAMGNSASELVRAAERARHQRRTDTAHDVSAPEDSEYAHPAARGVGQDVIDLVTDVFTSQREAEVRKRREVLYELTHPNPIDYTYNGKLVPPPPLSFGQVTAEARSLGNKMMLGQTYSLVRQAGTRASDDDFDVLGNSTNTAGCSASRSNSASPASSIETSVAAPLSTFSSRHAKGYCDGALAAPYRSSSREANIFRDHNYFFEINELYQEVVFVGRACAGKSSLLNGLLGQRVAKTSSMPNTTRKISFYQSVTPEQLHAFHAKERHSQLVKLPGGGLQLTFVDLPGFGIEGMSDKWRDAAIELTDAYFGVRRSVNTVLYCMDCERGLTKTDIRYFEWIENVHGTCFIVLTKCDSVPHSRICSVMRQVYTLITKHRRKYRKVFPFIIPVSAKDGTNIELLRGLITETSGIIPGDKLRDLLQQRKAAFTQRALLKEAARIDAARQLERQQAKAHFQLSRDGTSEGVQGKRSEQGAAAFSSVDWSKDAASLSGVAVNSPHRRYVLPLGNGAADAEAKAVHSTGASSSDAAGRHTTDFFPTEPSMATAAAEERRERRERFLAWRKAHPLSTVSPSYRTMHEETTGCDTTRPLAASKREADTSGSGRYRLNTGLDNPTASHAVLELHVEPSVPEGGRDACDKNSKKARHCDDERHAPISKETTMAAATESSPSPPHGTSMATGYHGRRFSVIGLGDIGADGDVGPDAAAAAAAAATDIAGPVSPTMSPSSLVRSDSAGSVSQFLDVMEQYGRQHNVVSSSKQKLREERLCRLGGRDSGRGRGRGCAVGGLLVEDASGRLSSYMAGKPCGPALVSTKTDVSKRQAEWRAEQLKTLLARENPEAPWAALHVLRRKIQTHEEQRALNGMRKKEVAAYVRDAGRVTASFEKFEGEVTAAKYMNEVRQAPTLRSQQQMHLNATAKINYRSMPPGLWKRYGEKDTYWQTSQVIGRSEDESHK
ncbi:hypothetical protein JKF63_04398 [Porcisia hertigi]|uniref:EngB-type G domain-containing protein n=1 Tax=Porcisia hertigi TaxID=2761500 RepID=A0A836LAE2_9TRYP|nr:hypothetical protein JKF63_04398 [Porcisia hertigi]